MALLGYIDESYSGEAVPEVFTLAAIFASGQEWFWIRMAWEKVLEEKNASLLSENRKLISRYHAVDCNARERDFAGWSKDERDEFVEMLFKVFRSHTTIHLSLSISVKLLVELWGEVSDPLALAYEILLSQMLVEVGFSLTQESVATVVPLVYERCDYGHIMQATFDRLMLDESFTYKHFFTSFAPMGWEQCVPLQLADLIAYEAFKDIDRRLPGKNGHVRKSLDVLLSMDSVGGRSLGFNRGAIMSLKEMVDAHKYAKSPH